MASYCGADINSCEAAGLGDMMSAVGTASS
jgi:hypothetical protein